MIKRAVYTLLALSLVVSSYAEETCDREKPCCVKHKTEELGYGSRDATVLSMMGWGLGLCIGIATLCGLMHQDTGS